MCLRSYIVVFLKHKLVPNLYAKALNYWSPQNKSCDGFS